MTQHTPGPWHADGEYVFDEIHARVCTVDFGDGGQRTVTGAGERNVDPSEEGHANARLIAAAPDLLAFAVSVVAWFESELTAIGLEEMSDDAKQLYSDAKAIVAKATA